jgi:hypothetical protein
MPVLNDRVRAAAGPASSDAGSPCELLLHEGPDRCDEVGNDDREAIEHLSVAQAQSFGLGAHFVERCSPLGVPDSLVG